MKSTLKKPHEKAVRTTITLPPSLFEKAQEICRREHYPALSDYFQARIRFDAGVGNVKTLHPT